MSDGAKVRLVSAGTGRQIDVPDSLTVAELRGIAGISDDVKLNFNGSTVTDEEGTELSDGDTIVATPEKVGHGS
jgi:hypothetical protein